MTLEKEFTITNKNGMHARPAATFVKHACQFQCEVLMEKDEEQVNGKSIMGLMMLAAARGEVVKLTTQGTDAEKAMADLGALIEAGFGDVD